MKVKCLYNTGKNLSQKFLDDGWTKESTMYLDINREYIVYGISFFKKDLCMYLITDKYLKPFWCPDEIFEITDSKISSLWHFKKFEKSDTIYEDWRFCGYYELIYDVFHSNDLMEREPKALDIFYKRKKEMDLESPAK